MAKSTTQIFLRGLGEMLFPKGSNQKNRRKVRITKDGQSREMRQSMAEGRRSRGEGKKPTTSQQRGNRVKSARAARAKGGPDRVTRGRGVSTRPATGNRGAQGPRTAPQQGPNRAVRGVIGERPKTTTRTPAPTRGPYNRGGSGPTSKPEPQTQTEKNVSTLRNLGRGALRMLSRGGAVGSVFNQSTSKNDTPSTVGVRSRGDAEQSIGKYNTMDKDGTVRNRLKVGPGKVGTVAEVFDKAYAQAKKDGKKTFTFKGKSYAVK